MNMKLLPIFAGIFVPSGLPVRAEDEGRPYLDADLPVERRIDDLMKRMTLREKIGQMCQYTAVWKKGRPSGLDDLTFKLEHAGAREYARSLGKRASLIRKGEIGSFLKVPGGQAVNVLQEIARSSRLKIPLLIATDAAHGHGQCTIPATIFPTQITLASSFDPSLAETMGRITAAEMRATGYRWSFFPNLAVVRDQRWGRTGETFGADPLVAAEMGRAVVRGLHGKTIGRKSVLACGNHIAAGGEPFNGINAGEADISERTLLGIHLPPFEACVREGLHTLMPAHNAINGVPCHANKRILTDIARKEWGFKGFVVSDWGDVHKLFSVLRVARSFKEACGMAVDAGIDVHMHGDGFLNNVEQLVKEGVLTEARIDRSVRAILDAKLRLGLFENAFADVEEAKKTVLCQEHREAALDIARKSLVLLKNDKELLPLKPDVKSILVTGPLADNQCLLGDWCGPQPDENVVTVLEGIRKTVSAGTRVDFLRCGDTFQIRGGTIKAAAEAAAKCDYAVAVVGENALRYTRWKTSGENRDGSSLQLPGNQRDLVEALHRTGTPVVVVLINSRALAVPWCAEHVPAILEAWLPGMMGGRAIADVLFGKVNPSGKLPISFPRSSGHLQCLHYRTPLRLGRYADSPESPLFPFGHGLSYTTFAYDNLKCPDKVKIGQPITVTVDVTNTGDRAGDEVVLLYVNDQFSSVVTPIKELKAFQRIGLKPGETKTVTFTLGPTALSLINAELKRVVEPGKFDIMVADRKGVLEVAK